jgi:hypothetical protein
MALDRDLAGHVIGIGGETVKRTQRESGASVRVPPRGQEGDTLISGPTPLSVLSACRAIATQTINQPGDGFVCACEVAGATLRATLRRPHVPAAAAEWLFTAADSAPEAAFTAACIGCAAPLAESALAAQLDDVAFAAGVSAEHLACAVGGGVVYFYAIGHAVGALQDALPSLCDRLCAPRLPAGDAGSAGGAAPAGSPAAAAAALEELLRGQRLEGLSEQDKLTLLREVGILRDQGEGG